MIFAVAVDQSPSGVLADAPVERGEAPRRHARSRPDWSRAGVEPSLAEVLEDPIVHLVLRRDDLTPSDVRRALKRARSRLRRADRENSGTGDERWRDQRG